MAGIYIHIPFCKQACTYCNFHFSVSLKNKDALVNAIAAEIMLTKKFSEEDIKTIYVGGGTPSLLNKTELTFILTTIREKYSVTGDAEITIEANPDDINKDSLLDWQRLGINRLSVGLQSFNEAELKWMNRAHDAAESLHCLDQITEAGFENYSVDLIYGSPLQTDEDLRQNFEILAQKKVPHISCYALTVEEGTVLNKLIKENSSMSPDPGKQSDQFSLLLDMMEAAGYVQYEISNFSLPGHRSRHNSSYWQGKPYYGFGPSAHSYDGSNIRRWNIANNSLYIKSVENGLLPFEEELLTAVQRMNEYVMTSLRTSEGLDMGLLKNNYGAEYAIKLKTAAEKYLQDQRMMQVGNVLILTKKGKFFADGIAADLFV